MNSFIITEDGIAISIGVKPYNVDRSHPQFDAILEAVRTDNWDAIPDLVSIVRAVKSFVGEKLHVDVEHGVITYDGDEINDTLAGRILSMMKEGFSIDPLVNFIKNMGANSSLRAIEELYTFIDHGKMPITPDGHFLAYKRVREDYKSVYDGVTDNSIGSIPEMPRNKVDDRSDVICSRGLHFCSHEYLSNFSGAKVVVLKVNPRDVVSIPTDYNNTKGRACRYEVVGELSSDEVKAALAGSNWDESVNVDYGNWDDRDYEDRDYEDRDYDDHDHYDEDDRDDFEFNGDGESFIGDEYYDPKTSNSQGRRSKDYVEGYDNGYDMGRNATPGSSSDSSPCAAGEWSDGYALGYKHGRGHKARINWVML